MNSVAPVPDQSYLVETLQKLARAPTEVPMGYETFIEPDDPKLVHYVQEVVRPELVGLGYDDLIDAPGNNLIVQVGDGVSGRSLLIQNYTPAQHHNLMADPFSGKLASAEEYGIDEPCVFGQGVSQNKAHQAVMLTVLKMIQEEGIELTGRLFWAVNNEGRSSHGCTNAILAVLPIQPEFCIVQIGTGLDLSLGNRGRVDIDVHVQGKATHSSAPEAGLSAIDGAHEVIQRLRSMTWTDEHPLLGGRHVLVYKVRYEPLAPHTLPSDAWLAIDHRMIPGDDPAEITASVRDAIGDLSPYEVTVEQGVSMLPALVEPDEPWVEALAEAHAVVTGDEPVVVYGQGTFDAGGPLAHGIPTVMYGASGGVGLTGPDFVPVSAVETEARVLLELIVGELS